MKQEFLIGAVALLTTGTPALANTWDASQWAASPQQVGRCQIDEAGTARRLEIRNVACRATDGQLLSDDECDGASKPEGTRWLACTMQWSCTDWHSGQFAEGPTGARYSFRPATTSKSGAILSCTNAKEANPRGVHSCRASLVDGELQRLSGVPTGFMSNPNYAWISCSKAGR